METLVRDVDASIPVSALLYDGEALLASQEAVGIYVGSSKAPDHQSGSVHVTTHRLLFITSGSISASVSSWYSSNTAGSSTTVGKDIPPSFSLGLRHVSRTEHFGGFLASSAKIELRLTHGVTATSSEDDWETWECGVCAHKNVTAPGQAASSVIRCELCGVPRDKVPSGSATPRQSSPAPERACSACTFLNPPTRTQCKMCGTRLAGAPEVNGSNGAGSMKLSFRKGGDRAFYAVLRRSLLSKAWEETKVAVEAASRSGIHGIMSNVTSALEASNTNMQDALQDLEAFMVKARDMVRLARELNAKLAAQASPPQSEEAAFVSNSLAQLGATLSDVPVTQDMVKDERAWAQSLARELVGVLEGDRGLLKERGIIGLDEVWGGWNRARGVALLPPSTLLLVLPLLPPSLKTRKLRSGAIVLHTPAFEQVSFNRRLCTALPRSTAEVARDEKVSVALAQELIEAAEMDGEVCRDDTGIEMTWYENLFRGYVWDGHIFE